MRTSVMTLWTLGMISDTSLLLDNAVMESRYDSAERSGRVTSLSTPLVILGKSGAGKTSLSLTLRDKAIPEAEGPPKTLGLEETLVEVSYVDMSWRDAGLYFLANLIDNEFTRALLFSVAFELEKQRVQLKKICSLGKVKVMLLKISLFAPLITLVVIFQITLPFNLFLFICCCFYALVNHSHNIHFIMGYGSALTVVSLCRILAQNYPASLEIQCLITRLMSSTILAYLISMCLGAGLGGGMSVGLCLFYPIAHGEDTNISILSAYTFLIIGHLAPFLKVFIKDSMLHNFVYMAFNMIVCVFLHRFPNELLFYSSFGLLTGYTLFFGLECGQKIAPMLCIGGNRNIFWTNITGFFLGCFVSYEFGWSIKPSSAVSLAFSVCMSAFAIFMLWHYYEDTNYISQYVSALQSLLDSPVNPRKPARIAVIDCAGDEVYRDAQHVYMTTFSNYIIVFRITDVDNDNCDCDATFEDVSQWLSSVSAHITASVPCVYLVATHRDTQKHRDRSSRLDRLEKRLQLHYGHLLMPVSRNADRCEVIFQIENHLRNASDAHLNRLRRSIVEHARSQEVPLVWFHFLDIVRSDTSREKLGGPLVDVTSLFDLVQHKCELWSIEEFTEMLQYFNDCGEIFFGGEDVQLSLFVLLDRSILSDIVRCLMRISSDGQQEDRPESYFDLDEIKRRLSHLVPVDSFSRLLAFLEALNFVLPVEPASFPSTFWVPFNLSMCSEALEDGLESLSRLCTAEFDFHPFNPSPLFLRLLPLCKRLHSGAEEVKLFRNAARFSVSGLHCIVRVTKASPHAISVLLMGPEDRSCAPAVLHQLTCLVRHLCVSHFRALRFSLRLKCLSCSEPRLLLLYDADKQPFRRQGRNRCRCGAERPGVGRVRPPDLVLSAGHVISFRFATDVLLLCHSAPPKRLLEVLGRVTDDNARRPMQLWAEGTAGEECWASRIASAHLNEARAAVVLVTAASNACGACLHKMEAAWKQANMRLIPVLMETSAPLPSLLSSLKPLSGLWEDEDEERLYNELSRTLDQVKDIQVSHRK